ncbi:MAG TPA: hypothetical protein V6D50_27495 [Chroococcales cyanobacterium]
MDKALKPLLKLALALTVVTLFTNRIFQLVKVKAQYAPVVTSQAIISTALKAAVEELRVMQIKIEGEGGINQKEYGENLDNLINIVNNAYGDSKTLAAVRSAVEGHKLARAFWQCNRIEGYDELHACRDKVIKSVFHRYPDIEAKAKAAVAGENLSYISAGLDEQAVLHAIWEKTAKDTETAVAVSNPNLHLKKSSS